jgi:hypothetical protein
MIADERRTSWRSQLTGAVDAKLASNRAGRSCARGIGPAIDNASAAIALLAAGLAHIRTGFRYTIIDWLTAVTRNTSAPADRWRRAPAALNERTATISDGAAFARVASGLTLCVVYATTIRDLKTSAPLADDN